MDGPHQTSSPDDDLAVYDDYHDLPEYDENETRISLVTTRITTSLGSLCGLVIAALGALLLVKAGARDLVAMATTLIGASLGIWHLTAIARGAGRRHARVNRHAQLGLLSTVGFGLVTGYGLCEMATQGPGHVRLVLLAAGIVGLVTSLVIISRDTDRADLAEPVEAEQIQDEDIPAEQNAEPAIRLPELDEDETGGELYRRGQYPLPRRGSSADAQLWDSFEDEPRPRRARRGI